MYESRFGIILFGLSFAEASLSSKLQLGRTSTSARIIPSNSSSVSNTPSTFAVFSLTYSAAEVSSFVILFSAKAFGEFTNNFAPSFVMKVKSDNDGTREAPPPHAPKTAVI